MNTLPPWRAALRLTRPDQWPILTAQFLLPVMMLAPAARGGGCWLNPASGAVLAVAWFTWVVMLNGGTLAFNSAFDRDVGPVAYLPDPPPPPSWLAPASLLFMLVGIPLSYLVVGPAFALVTAICVGLSVLYSAPVPRLKARPGMDLLVNMLGYGAGTTLAGFLAGWAAYFGHPAACVAGGWRSVDWPGLQGGLTEQFAGALAGGAAWLVLAFGLLFGSLYPLTQLYQMVEDRERGDRTLCTALGARPSLTLALVLALVAMGALVLGLGQRGAGWALALPLAAGVAWLVHLLRWWKREPDLADGARQKGMYRALTLWAVVDAAVLAAWYLGGA